MHKPIDISLFSIPHTIIMLFVIPLTIIAIIITAKAQQYPTHPIYHCNIIYKSGDCYIAPQEAEKIYLNTCRTFCSYDKSWAAWQNKPIIDVYFISQKDMDKLLTYSPPNSIVTGLFQNYGVWPFKRHRIYLTTDNKATLCHELTHFFDKLYGIKEALPYIMEEKLYPENILNSKKCIFIR